MPSPAPSQSPSPVLELHLHEFSRLWFILIGISKSLYYKDLLTQKLLSQLSTPPPVTIATATEMSALMMELSPADVPEYLREGSFYASLDQSNDTHISVPANVVKPDLSITTQEDLDHALSSIRFWGLQEVPFEIIEYLLTAPAVSTVSFDADFPTLAIAVSLRDIANNQQRLNASVSHGSLHLVKYFLRVSCVVTDDEVDLALEKGHTEIFSHFNDLSPLPAEGPRQLKMCQIAFQNGHLGCLKCLQSLGYTTAVVGMNILMGKQSANGYVTVPDLITFQFALEVGCVMNWRLPASAATCGDVEVLKLAHQSGHEVDRKVGFAAADAQSLSCLQYYIDNSGEWSISLVEPMVRRNWLEGLQYAHNNGYPLVKKSLTLLAAELNHLEVLQYLHAVGCDWNEEVTYEAILRGHMRCVQYAYENGCPLPRDGLQLARNKKRADVEEYLLTLDQSLFD